jgi:hypothetical protein
LEFLQPPKSQRHSTSSSLGPLDVVLRAFEKRDQSGETYAERERGCCEKRDEHDGARDALGRPAREQDEAACQRNDDDANRVHPKEPSDEGRGDEDDGEGHDARFCGYDSRCCGSRLSQRANVLLFSATAARVITDPAAWMVVNDKEISLASTGRAEGYFPTWKVGATGNEGGGPHRPT